MGWWWDAGSLRGVGERWRGKGGGRSDSWRPHFLSNGLQTMEYKGMLPHKAGDPEEKGGSHTHLWTLIWFEQYTDTHTPAHKSWKDRNGWPCMSIIMHIRHIKKLIQGKAINTNYEQKCAKERLFLHIITHDPHTLIFKRSHNPHRHHH